MQHLLHHLSQHQQQFSLASHARTWDNVLPITIVVSRIKNLSLQRQLAKVPITLLPDLIERQHVVHHKHSALFTLSFARGHLPSGWKSADITIINHSYRSYTA